MTAKNYKDLAVEAGIVIAYHTGIESVTLQSVADTLGVYRQAIGHHYDIDSLREAVERAALDRQIVPVMAQAVTGPRSSRYPVTPDQLNAISVFIVGGRG